MAEAMFPCGTEMNHERRCPKHGAEWACEEATRKAADERGAEPTTSNTMETVKEAVRETGTKRRKNDEG